MGCQSQSRRQNKNSPVRVRGVFLMFQHVVPAYVSSVPSDAVPVETDSV